MTPRLSPVLDARDLPLAELQAARLDGEVFAIGEGFAPIDEQEQSRHRARSLATLMHPRFIAAQMTAAWVHGAVRHPPAVHQFHVSYSARARKPTSKRFTLREVVIGDGETTLLGGILVTEPMRTAVDLLRADADFDVSEAAAVRELLGLARLGPDECRAVIVGRHKLAGKQRALSRLEQLGSRW